ncbi:MAG: large conductance mechanosensitive channel protein MscL [Bacteroidaceae bacterium]|nr:large conductance mechanosensitive channel protein MscL [Bacteroidaceae bacterium]
MAKCSFLQDFKDFAMKGNVMDMAVGVIIGGAFGKIVTSLVGDILMPVISLATGGIDFTNLFVNLSDDKAYNTLAEAQEAGASVFAYGQFLQNILDFLIIAFCIFLMIKGIAKLNRKKEEAPAPEPEPKPSNEEVLLTEIRDLLKKKA